VLKQFGIESLSSSQVSRAAKLLDEELEAWRNRPLGEIRYLIIDARYEKVRLGGVVRDAAVLSAMGIGPDGRPPRARCLLRPLGGRGAHAGVH
jgi:putative transposase